MTRRKESATRRGRPSCAAAASTIPWSLAVARAHGRTPAQVLLRWDLQHGVVTIPKCVHRERIAENAALFDFELTADEMKAIDALDAGTRIGPNPDHVNF